MKVNSVLEDKNNARQRALRLQQQLLDAHDIDDGGLETTINADDQWVSLETSMEIGDDGHYMDIYVKIPVDGGEVSVIGDCHAVSYDEEEECTDEEVLDVVRMHINSVRSELYDEKD